MDNPNDTSYESLNSADQARSRLLAYCFPLTHPRRELSLLLFDLSRPRRLIELSNLTQTASRTLA